MIDYFCKYSASVVEGRDIIVNGDFKLIIPSLNHPKQEEIISPDTAAR